MGGRPGRAVRRGAPAGEAAEQEVGGWRGRTRECAVRPTLRSVQRASESEKGSGVPRAQPRLLIVLLLGAWGLQSLQKLLQGVAEETAGLSPARPLHCTAAPRTPLCLGNAERRQGAEASGFLAVRRGSERLWAGVLRPRPGAPGPASPRGAAAVPAPPPDGSRRFAIAPPGGSARQAGVRARGAHECAPGSGAVPSGCPPGPRPPRRAAQATGRPARAPRPVLGPHAAAGARVLIGVAEAGRAPRATSPAGGRQAGEGGSDRRPRGSPWSPPTHTRSLRCRPGRVGGDCHPTGPPGEVRPGQAWGRAENAPRGRAGPVGVSPPRGSRMRFSRNACGPRGHVPGTS